MNENISNIIPYKLSVREFSKEITYLDWNEGLPLPKEIEEKILNRLRQFNLYTDPTNTLIKNSISKYTTVQKNFIEVFNGSDSALDLAFRSLVNSKDKVLIPYPNYSQVLQTLSFLGADIIYCNVEDIETSLKKEKPKVVYLSNPNNPIGYLLNVKPIILNYPNTIFIIDEAYYEYSKLFTVFDLAQHIDNLIVTRTFSKAFGLAGVRLGYLTSNYKLLTNIRKIKNFKEINILAEISSIEVLDNFHLIQNEINKVLNIKKQFVGALSSKVTVYPSETNFVLIESKKYEEIIRELKSNKILVRDRSDFIKNTIRISISRFEIMKKVAEIINRVVENEK